MLITSSPVVTQIKKPSIITHSRRVLGATLVSICAHGHPIANYSKIVLHLTTFLLQAQATSMLSVFAETPRQIHCYYIVHKDVPLPSDTLVTKL